MEKEEEINKIVRDYDYLTNRSKDLTNQINQIWAQKEKLRSEYQTLTGKDISYRHEVK